MDFIVKLPLSHGYDSIFVVCDRLTRAAHFIPCRESMTAPDLAWLFLDRIFRLHGLPHSIVSDRGSLFVSNFWRSLMTLLKVDLRTSTAYHPQTDGLTERTNQTLEAYLRAFCSYQQDDWVDYLPLAEFSFNNLENSSTHQTPFFANLAYHPTFEPQLAQHTTVPAAKDLAQRLDQIHTELRAELEHAQSLQSKYYNAHHIPDPNFKEDQLVWLLRRNIKTTRPSDKLDHHRLGPYRVIKKIGSSAYLLQLPSYLARLHPVFHVSLLEPYKDPSEFHPHSDPTPFSIPDESPSISSILDCRKVGHRYEYFVSWKNLPSEENSWIPLSDIPTFNNELVDRFHRRHPRAPHPHPITISKHFSPLPDPLPYIPIPELTTNPSSVSDPPPPDPASIPASAVPLPPAVVPPAMPRPPSPPPVHQNLTSVYKPPAQTTTRSGRVSKPAERLDPEL
jgi:transposase InsO family protein